MKHPDDGRVFSEAEIRAKLASHKRVIEEFRKAGDPRGSPETLRQILLTTRMVMEAHNAKIKGEWN